MGVKISKPLIYTCSMTGIVFPKIYRIRYPAMFGYSLVPHSEIGSIAEQAEEVCDLSSDVGVDLHLTYFPTKDEATGFVLATDYWHKGRRVSPSVLDTEAGSFVLVPIRSEASTGRIHFNSYEGEFKNPMQAIFDSRGVLRRHPSDQ